MLWAAVRAKESAAQRSLVPKADVTGDPLLLRSGGAVNGSWLSVHLCLMLLLVLLVPGDHSMEELGKVPSTS